MIDPDLGMLAFAATILSFASALIIHIFDATRRQAGSFRAFALSGLLFGLGMLLILFQNLGNPFLMVLAGNLLALTSVIACHIGVTGLCGRRPVVPLYCLAVAGYLVGHIIYSDVHNDMMGRIAVTSLVRAALCAHAALVLRTTRRSGAVVIGVALETVFWGWAALLVLRAAACVGSATPVLDFFALSGFMALYFGGLTIVMIALTASLFVTDFERTEAVLEQRITDKTKALSKAKEAADRALAAKSQFLTAASHDLRQPVHTLQLLLPMIQTTLTHGTLDQTADLVAEASGAGRRLSDLLDSLLDISRLEAGVVVPTLSCHPLGPILAGLKSQFRAVADNADVRFEVVMSSLTAHTDPALLTRILANLVSNAIRFSGGGVVVGCRRRGAQVEVQVCDNGVGIPADMTAAIFDEFRQIGSSARQNDRGLGLGLAIVKHIAPLLGVRVDVRSTPGRGSVFSVLLPLGRAHEANTAATGRRLPAAFGAGRADDWIIGRVIIVGADARSATATEALLSPYCLLLQAYSCTDDALRACGEAPPPDVLIADLALPGPIDGLDWIRRARAAIGATIPSILFIDEPELPAHRQGQRTLPMRKPVDPEALLHAIRNYRIREHHD